MRFPKEGDSLLSEELEREGVGGEAGKRTCSGTSLKTIQCQRPTEVLKLKRYLCEGGLNKSAASRRCSLSELFLRGRGSQGSVFLPLNSSAGPFLCPKPQG